MSALQELLKDTFGYDDFRPGQKRLFVMYCDKKMS